MQENYQISVVVPVFNAQHTLKRLIDSFLIQVGVSSTDYEIIFVDDGSVDDSFIILNEFEKKYDNIRVVHQDNCGPSAARNKGIKMSKGQYILFCDSDDYVENGCIAKIQGIIEKENTPDIIYFGYCEEYESTDKQLIKYGYVSAKNCSFTGEKFALEELKQRNLYAAACFGVYKRAFIVENQLYFESGILHEDELWTPQVILRANKVYTSDYVFYHYLRRKGSITRSGNKTKHGQDMLCICKKLDILANEIKNPELKKYMDNHIAMLYMKGMTEGRLYQTNMEIDRFYPLRKVCFKKDRAKAILFAFSLRLYYRINIMKMQG